SGQEVVREIANRSDVLVTNLVPRRQERYGLRYEDLESSNPRLVYVSLTGYGMDGPERDRLGFDYAGFWSRAGLNSVMGEPDGVLTNPRPGQGDQTTAIAMAAGVGFALFEREKSGKGQRIDCSLLHTGMWTIAADMVAAYHSKKAVKKVSRKAARTPLSNPYCAGDGKWMQIGVGDRFWSQLCRILDAPELEHDPRFDNPERRERNSHALIELLDERFATHPREYWAERLEAEQGIWAPVQTLDEVVSDPQVEANGYIEPLGQIEQGQYGVVAIPMKFQRTPPQPRGPAPEIGENTEEVLLDLGYSWDQILELKEEGASI
ncbi:CoA transferase, partial [Dehalococcoidia bacterium]|nr:CoA transferase [Dehalococcoidia bacterium]